MFVLEYKQLHIVKEPQRKNCTHQTYRWKPYAKCDIKGPLEAILDNMEDKDRWRIEEYPCS